MAKPIFMFLSSIFVFFLSISLINVKAFWQKKITAASGDKVKVSMDAEDSESGIKEVALNYFVHSNKGSYPYPVSHP
ncbi:hypothetical protein V7150_17950 [Neobacillus drentensis]|uniref:hypothetical protein n=1 Tax=Neobacillus drentensis TaxID=220684 RepID=UPI002FFFD7E2